MDDADQKMELGTHQLSNHFERQLRIWVYSDNAPPHEGVGIN